MVGDIPLSLYIIAPVVSETDIILLTTIGALPPGQIVYGKNKNC